MYDTETLTYCPVLIYDQVYVYMKMSSKVWELNHLFDRQTNNEDDIIFDVQVCSTAPAHSALSIRES